MNNSKKIGVIAGAGPFAGVDLLQKIFQETLAESDAGHLDVIAVFKAASLPDRTGFLLGNSDVENPGYAMARQALELKEAGADIVAIPCNTAHAPQIFDVMLSELEQLQQTVDKLEVLHLIRETGSFIKEQFPEIKKVGLLSTTGTWKTGIYPLHLEPLGLEVLLLDEDTQLNLVHPAIYDPHYGIKTGRITDRAHADMLTAAEMLVERGAEAVILGCTEIPLAVTEKYIGSAVTIDPSRALARALIRSADPQKLRPFEL